MADIINLRQARKAKARADAEQASAANRAKFGRTKADRQADKAEKERVSKLIEGARRDPSPKAGDGWAGDGVTPIRSRRD
jgi:hypothetical protein